MASTMADPALPSMFGFTAAGEEVSMARLWDSVSGSQLPFAPAPDTPAQRSTDKKKKEIKKKDKNTKKEEEKKEADIWCFHCVQPASTCKSQPDHPAFHPLLPAPPSSRASSPPKARPAAKSNADQSQGYTTMESGTEAGSAAATATATLPAEMPVPFADAIAPPADHDIFDTGILHLEQEQTYHLDIPVTPHTTAPAQQSDAPGTRPDTPNTERVANILANGALHAPAEDITSADMNAQVAHDHGTSSYFPAAQLGNGLGSWPAMDNDGKNPNEGFAKLMFPDGDYIITSHDVEVGRNMEIAAHYRRELKEAKRTQQREQRRERVPPAQKQLAQRELEMYQQEPSQPSLPGDDPQQADASNSSHSLEGRPAAQTTFSETGGALAFAQDSDEEASGRRGRKKRRSMQHSKSSTSTTSVVPANLHPPIKETEMTHRDLFTDDGEPYTRSLAILPIHTQRPEDITKISKKHLLFSFNFQEEQWELYIQGNGAFLNEEFIERGNTVALSHNDEIQIATVTITFKLPDSRNSPGLSRGTFSQVGLEDVDDLSGAENPAGTSPVRRLSNPFENAVSSDEEQAETEKRPKLKLKGLKKPQKEKRTSSNAKQKAADGEQTPHKLNLKKQQRRRSNESPSPDEGKKAEKGKKPKAAAKQPPEPKAEKAEEATEKPPAPPVFTAEPGSALASVPVDELPQKRKGPGRPPKNGLVSKRDQALVKKKERDYEKLGMIPPPFNKILEIVRAETKQKEMMTKMQNGALPPGTELPPAIEPDLAAAAVKVPAASVPVESIEQTGDAPAESMRRPSSPRPKRLARSPSPMKPESSYTELDLKKPSATYVHILDEILRDHPAGQADLQEIYDRIQKRYPFYKYRVPTQGWQSSVRHNLLSAPRFKETGRSGKGKMWTIDHDIPLEKEKRKKTPPPPRTTPMVNGQYAQYGQQPYGNGYGPPQNGQRPVNGGPGYYSPYPQGQQGQHPGMQNQQGPSPSAQPQPNAGQTQADAFGGLVPEILTLRNAFLQPYTNEPNMQAKSDWIGKCIMVFSNRFHGSGEQPALTVETPEEKKAYADLDAIFKRYEALKAQQQQGQQNAASGPSAQQGGAAPSQPNMAPENGAAQPTVSQQEHQQQQQQQQQQTTVQTAVADGVAYQNANSGLSPTASRAPAGPPSAGQTQITAHSVPSQTASAPASSYTGAHGLPPTPSAPALSTVQSPQPAGPSASVIRPPSYAQQPPQAAAYVPQQHNQYAPTPSGSATSAGHASPAPQPPASNSPHVQTAPQVNIQPPAAPPGPSPSAGHPSPSIQAPTADGPVQPARREEPKSTDPAPPSQPPAQSSGTKRAAEDDAPIDNEAKRTKMDE